jgi:hypothetical protein
MPRSEGAVLTTTREGELVRVRPEPPADLWDQLAVLNEKAGIPERQERPPDSFTTKEYAEKFGISGSAALRRIEKLTKAGDLKKYGNLGVSVFYTVVQR